MTKQELIKMMGDEDKANWALQRVLEQIKPDFVIMCLKAYADQKTAEYTQKNESGYYTENSSFPEGFNLFSVDDDHPLAIQYDKNRKRQIEKAGDLTLATFAKNMHVHALWNVPAK